MRLGFIAHLGLPANCARVPGRSRPSHVQPTHPQPGAHGFSEIQKLRMTNQNLLKGIAGNRKTESPSVKFGYNNIFFNYYCNTNFPRILQIG